MSISWSAWFLLGLALSGPVPAAEEKILNVYNWADYIAPDTIAVFEKEFSIRVNYDLYDATAVVEAKLLEGLTGYDVVLQALRFSTRAFMYRVDMVRERMPDAPVDSAAMLFDPAAYPPMEARQGWQTDLLYGPKPERLRAWSRVKTGL